MKTHFADGGILDRIGESAGALTNTPDQMATRRGRARQWRRLVRVRY